MKLKYGKGRVNEEGPGERKAGDNVANTWMVEAGTGWGPQVLSGAVGLPDSVLSFNLLGLMQRKVRTFAAVILRDSGVPLRTFPVPSM